MKCPECRFDAPSVLKNQAYLYAESGLRNVTLKGISIISCARCGAHTPIIPQIEGLHRVIARIIIEKKAKLVPEEIRFLRKYLGLSGVDLAAMMGVTRESISRWENGQETMGNTSERLLRLLVAHQKPVENYALESLREAGTSEQGTERFEVVPEAKGWVLAA